MLLYFPSFLKIKPKIPHPQPSKKYVFPIPLITTAPAGGALVRKQIKHTAEMYEKFQAH